MSDKEDLKKYFDEDNQNQPHKLPGKKNYINVNKFINI